MSKLWSALYLPMRGHDVRDAPKKPQRQPRARNLAAEVRETLKYERPDWLPSRLVGTPKGPHVQTPASDSRARGATHLPVAGGSYPVGNRSGRKRMQGPSETRDVHAPSVGVTTPPGRQQQGRTVELGMAPPRTAR